jgi:glutathione S-transferase
MFSKKVNFLAKKCHLMPENEFDAALADMYALQFTDVLNSFLNINMNQNQNFSGNTNRTQNRFDQFFSGIWSLTLNRTEEQICANGHGVIAGRHLSYADIYLSSLLDLAIITSTNRTREQYTNAYPNIRQLDLRVRSLPRVAEWLIVRPKNDF